MKTRGKLLLLFVFALLCSSCSPTRTLTDRQQMLMRNNVTVTEAPGTDFSNLKSYCRPIPNTRFLNIFLVKPRWYALGQPRYSKRDSTYHDGKVRQWMRNKLGEEPVLLDSAEIEKSIGQLQIVMKQSGYFDADVSCEVFTRRRDHKKATANYFIKAGKAYHISRITYDIAIPEYKKIIVLNKNGSLLHEGMQYNETVISSEMARIINLIRDEGYYYVEKSILSCEVSFDLPEATMGNDTNSVSLTFTMRIPETTGNTNRYLYKYTYNDVFVYPFFNASAALPARHDTVLTRSRNKGDLTNYYFITPRYDWMNKPIKDFHYSTITDGIYTRRGIPYSQNARKMSSRAISRLDNFSAYSIEFVEDENLFDTLKRTGVLDVHYRLTPMKIHSVGGQVDLRNDKSAISFSYSNRNLFRGAEHLTVNLSGGYFYYSLNNLFRNDRTYAYPEFVISASLTFPNLFLFRKTQREDGISYSTAINAGVGYSGLYHRLIFNTGLTYQLKPNNYISHNISPIDISTVNNNDKRTAHILNYDSYPESYQHKFGKFFLLSFKYSLNYIVPFKTEKKKHNMLFSLNLESSGMTVGGLNALISPNERWTLSRNHLDSTGYDYTSFEKVEFIYNYTYRINPENAVAMRLSAGGIIPIGKGSYIPYERGFYMGTSNSMRGWGYRGLGPGSYERQKDSLFTGDIMLELNLEYRGTIYNSFKFGIFADLGNIWLAQKNADMPNADFDVRRFYRELALDIGAGLRLDFDFLIIRIDYALPVYDPTRTSWGRWINSQWFHGNRKLKWMDGFKLAFGYAF